MPPGDRGIWVKSKCLNREEFVVVGWTDPEGSRSHIGALLLGLRVPKIRFGVDASNERGKLAAR
jgi:ATP-dependent DNA ligase